jgi:hypothetical protein
VQERKAIVARMSPTVSAPVAAAPKTRKPKAAATKVAEPLKPSEMARRANNHKIDCSCGMCVKLGYVMTSQAGCDEPKEPKAKVAKPKHQPKAAKTPVQTPTTSEEPATSTGLTALESWKLAYTTKVNDILATEGADGIADSYCELQALAETMDAQAEQAQDDAARKILFAKASHLTEQAHRLAEVETVEA